MFENFMIHEAKISSIKEQEKQYNTRTSIIYPKKKEHKNLSLFTRK